MRLHQYQDSSKEVFTYDIVFNVVGVVFNAECQQFKDMSKCHTIDIVICKINKENQNKNSTEKQFLIGGPNSNRTKFKKVTASPLLGLSSQVVAKRGAVITCMECL